MLHKRPLWLLAVVLLAALSWGQGSRADAQTDPGAATSTSFEAGRNLVSGTAQCGYLYYPAGWYIVGGPAGFTIPGATGNLYALGAGDTTYQTVPVTSGAKRGYGYWAYFPSDVSLLPSEIPGMAPPTGTGADTIQVTVPKNQPVLIGNPFTTPASVSGVDDLTIYQPQTGTYVSTFSLGRGQGAWAFSLNGGQATLKSICPPPP